LDGGYAVTSHSSQSKTVDEVLLVASSKSFAAVNREQFYVSISRGRERERKAAVELQALRDELARLGFVRKEPLEEKNTVSAAMAVRKDSAVRPARQVRPMRFTRLSPVQRLAQVVEEIAHWLGEMFRPGQVFARGHKDETIIEKVEQTEAVKPTETVKPALTVREARLQREAARRKLGRGITPPGDTGHSHSRGIGV
jgi:hypothetical protein